MFASKHMPKKKTDKDHDDMPEKYHGKSTKPGMGGRMAMMVDDIMEDHPGMSMERARAIAASAGRKNYGGGQMAEWSAAGRKRGQ